MIPLIACFIPGLIYAVSPIYVDYTYKGTEYKNIFLKDGRFVEDKEVGDSIDVVVNKKNPSDCMYRGTYSGGTFFMKYVFVCLGIILILIGVFEKYTMKIQKHDDLSMH